MEIEVWERASYPSGRFGAGLEHHGRWLDLGAQVLSAIEVDSGHPNAGADGHNLQKRDLFSAWAEVQRLESLDLLRRVPEERLADTEERMKYEKLWAHFWCVKGFAWLLRHWLREGGANLRRGRVDAVRDGQVVVNGVVQEAPNDNNINVKIR